MVYLLFRALRPCLLGFAILYVPSVRLMAQLPPDSNIAFQKNAIGIYLDCSSCDFDYTRKNITFVNFLRDPVDAQVHILMTSQKTASGGDEYTLTFMGKKEYAGINDTLVYISRKSDTQDIIRTGITNLMKLGLIRYAAHTPTASEIIVSHSKPESQEKAVDSWNNWLFTTSINGMFNGQHSYSSTNIFWSLSSNRITKDIKINFSLNGSYYKSTYDYDTISYVSISRSNGFNGNVVFSIDDHWSWGIFGSASTSTYSNLDFSGALAPAVEYNIFPYTESTRRVLRIAYKPWISYSNYIQETVYGKMDETLAREELSVTLDQKEPWGSTSVSLSGSHYFHDLTKYNVGIFTSLSLRIIEGLSAQFYGSYSKQHDQLGLAAEGVTVEDVLLQRRELESQYSYFVTIGMSYSFGSIFNNIVNPRFGNSGSGGYSISISSD